MKPSCKWFRIYIHGFLLIKSIYWLLYYDLLFGTDSIMYSQPHSISSFKDLAFLLYSFPSTNLAYFFIVGLFSVVCIYNFVNIKATYLNYVLNFVLWFLVSNIHNALYLSLTAGDYLLNQFLFFNIFLSSKYDSTHKPVAVFLHNFAVVAIIAQVCFAYFMAGVAKINDSRWMEGNAFANIVQVNHYNLYSFFSYSESLNWSYLMVNYAVIFYQLLFPIFIWIEKIKKPLLILGIIMNLYIAFVMGLMSLGIVMIMGYTFLWPLSAKEN